MSGIITIAGKAVEFPNDNNIKQTFGTVIYHLLKCRTVVCLCGQRTVDI